MFCRTIIYISFCETELPAIRSVDLATGKMFEMYNFFAQLEQNFQCSFVAIYKHKHCMIKNFAAADIDLLIWAFNCRRCSNSGKVVFCSC